MSLALRLREAFCNGVLKHLVGRPAMLLLRRWNGRLVVCRRWRGAAEMMVFFCENDFYDLSSVKFEVIGEECNRSTRPG